MVITPSMTFDEGGIDTEYLSDNVAVGSIKVWEYSVTRGFAEVTEATLSDIESYADNPEDPDIAVLDIQSGVLRQIILIRV